MRVENLTSKPRKANYLGIVLAGLGALAATASTIVAWPALTHLGDKLL